MNTKLKIFLGLISLVFFILFLIKAAVNMSTIPFHDFDEAHRAEKAKKMKEYYSFLVPLTGSPVDRSNDLKISLRENSNLFLYYHPERPPLFYWLMIISTSYFGTDEWVYRLPSLIMAILTVAAFLVFSIYFPKKTNFFAIFLGLLILLTSADLWLSGQYAQMDTTLTFFLFSSVLSLIYYCETKHAYLLLISGLSFSLAILGKGQPAIIFIFPFLYLWLSKRLGWKKLLQFCVYAGIVIIPWLILLGIYFDLARMIYIFTHFAASSTFIEYSHIKAPIFWYIRWWFDSLRPGWVIFLALFLIDFYEKRLDWKKKTLLAYISGGFIFFSISSNKIWWYVLPLVPAIAFYTYLSATEYLVRNKEKLSNLSLVIILASIPILTTNSNKITLVYGIFLTLLSFVILRFRHIKLFTGFKETSFLIAITISLFFFYQNFPQIVPYHHNTKFVAQYYKDLPGRKCLWIKEMPPETALFYSNAGELMPLTLNKSVFSDCKNYLMTPVDTKEDTLTYLYNGKHLYLKDQPVIFQKGSMKLISLDPQ